MAQQEPLFSVITVTWNAAQVLSPTLQSVREQSFTRYEYLVVDGASTDATLQLVNQAHVPGTRIVSEPDKGLYDAMNKAIGLAKGRYLIFLNAGDRFASPHVLEAMARCAAQSPGVIYGQTDLVDATGRVVGHRHLTAPKNLTFESFKQGMLVCHQAFVVRRDLAPAYDLQYRFSADYEWCLRVLQVSPANAYVGDEPIIHFLTDGLTHRYHSQSLRERYRIMCHYYGTIPTMLRHAGFVPRYLANKWRNSHHKP